MAEVSVRPRRPDDVPRLVEILAEQQPTSRYPYRWPLPFPPERFIARPGELAAFVAERGPGLLGHVCVQEVDGSAATNGIDDDELTASWSRSHDRPAHELATVSALFTSVSARGTGAGGALLDAAVAWIRGHGLAPCLDVLSHNATAVAIYEKRGWVRVGMARPPWLSDDEPPVIAMVLRG